LNWRANDQELRGMRVEVSTTLIPHFLNYILVRFMPSFPTCPFHHSAGGSVGEKGKATG
jgi:hypothetical protein